MPFPERALAIANPTTPAPIIIISELKSAEALKMIEDGTISAGFIPKIHSAIEALKDVKAVAIVSGKKSSILFELFSDKGSGTLLRP